MARVSCAAVLLLVGLGWHARPAAAETGPREPARLIAARSSVDLPASGQHGSYAPRATSRRWWLPWLWYAGLAAVLFAAVFVAARKLVDAARMPEERLAGPPSREARDVTHVIEVPLPRRLANCPGADRVALPDDAAEEGAPPSPNPMPAGVLEEVAEDPRKAAAWIRRLDLQKTAGREDAKRRRRPQSNS
ncbi:MAG: hypothetical protein JXR37_23850 [Kiritimatiellae bacterium]|nr:hypothetical protein [Kiritimatiellia bacterium]